MAQVGQRNGVFYGWYVVAACTLCISTGPGPFAFASMGLFMVPFEAEFGWTRAQMGLCQTLMVIATAVCMPICGRVVDRIG